MTAAGFGLAYGLMPERDVAALASGWLQRFSAPSTLAFTTQMALVLVMGAALARAPRVARVLGWLAELPRGTRGAVALTASMAMLAGLLNWGFGLMVGALLARAVGERFAREGKPIDYPLVGAAGYTGMLVWHGGLSGSAPLKVTEGTPGGGPPLGLDTTLFSPLNLALTAGLLLFVPWLLARMVDPARQAVPELPERPPAPAAGPDEPKIARLLLLFVLLLGAGALALRVSEAPSWWRALDLSAVILVLVLAGLLLHGSPQRYARAFGASAPEAGGILLQFPFYFGILGLLEAGGMVGWFAEHVAGLARGLAEVGLPLGFAFDGLTFASAGLVNLFVPSGGGQWAVQGTIVTAACEELGLPLARGVMAMSYGDEWTNMLQPFWALALLGITGLKARDILGYTLVVMLGSAFVFLGAFALF